MTLRHPYFATHHPPLGFIRRLIAIFILLLPIVSGCSSTLPPMPALVDKDGDAFVHAASLRSSVIDIVKGGGNLGRLEAVRRRAVELGLANRLRFEPIDWFTVQRNMIIDIPGASPRMIYIVAHYDKTDSNPLKLASLLLNGALDELISFAGFSDGALDNATGVAVSLELAAALNRTEHRYSYRILFVGAEESGLRGSRAHIARLSAEERSAVELAVNVDTVGVAYSPNCVSDDTGYPVLLEKVMSVAHDLKLDLGRESGAVTDHIPFRGTSAWNDFLLGLQYNYVGGVLPQRSWFTSSFSVPVVNFTACGLVEPWNDITGLLLFPIGKIHGMQDRLDQVSVSRLYEQFRIIRAFLDVQDHAADLLFSVLQTPSVTAP